MEFQFFFGNFPFCVFIKQKIAVGLLYRDAMCQGFLPPCPVPQQLKGLLHMDGGDVFFPSRQICQHALYHVSLHDRVFTGDLL